MDRQEIVGFERLYESHLKAQKGVRWKDSVAWFSLHGLEETLKLSNQLKDGTYKPRPPVSFTITKPKRREVVAVKYRDRVYQRSINDNALYPAMTKSFIRENGACQIGKGTDFCLDLFRRNLRRFYINHGLNGYILQMDVKGYYPNMNHAVCKEMFRKKLKPEICRMVEEVLDHQYSGDAGYNPGSQMVQIAGISLLDGIDHFVKEKLHIRDYIRVMDDMILLHGDRDYLEYCRDEIIRELALLKLEPNTDKTKIVPLSAGVTFLGFNWKVTETGKVLAFVKSRTVKDFRHTLTKLMKMYARGERSRKCIEDSKRSRMEFMGKGNSHKLLERLEQWYEERMDYYEHQRIDVQSKKHVPEGTCGIR